MAKNRELEDMRIEPADEPLGSSQIHVSHKPPKTQSPGGMWSGNRVKISATTPEEAGAHVTRLIHEHVKAKSGSAAPKKKADGLAGDEPDAGPQQAPQG